MGEQIARVFEAVSKQAKLIGMRINACLLSKISYHGLSQSHHYLRSSCLTTLTFAFSEVYLL